jgi:hypothetical protein
MTTPGSYAKNYKSDEIQVFADTQHTKHFIQQFPLPFDASKIADIFFN